MSKTDERSLTETAPNETANHDADHDIAEEIALALTGYWEQRQAERERKRAAWIEMQARRKAACLKMQNDLETMQAERDAVLAAEAAKLKKTGSDQTLREQKHIRKKLYWLRQSQGDYAGHFFRQAVLLSKSFCGMEYHSVTKYGMISTPDLEEYFDMILHNGDGTIMLVEIEYEFHLHDLKTFVKRKANHFRKLFPLDADKTIYLAIAGFLFEDGVAEEAKSLGIAVIQRDGTGINVDSKNLQTF